jgi:hypothetical protein
MPRIRIKYNVDENDLKYAHDLDMPFILIGDICDFEVEQMAQEAAEDYYWNHDGRERRWPIDFYIYDKEGLLLGVCNVDIEQAPCFSASIKDEPPEIADSNAVASEVGAATKVGQCERVMFAKERGAGD